MSAKSLTEAILEELEITQGTAENIAAILNEPTSKVTSILRTLEKDEQVRQVPHKTLIIYRHNTKPTKNNPTTEPQ